MQKLLIVGLGNPGEQYVNSRHNVGFQVLDKLVDDFHTEFSEIKLGHLAEFNIKGKKVLLLKPSTFMNLSGKSIHYHLISQKVNISNLLIIADDLNLDFGMIKLKKKGSSGGHNGHKDIIDILNTSNYARLKFGIGSHFKEGKQSDYVLGQWSEKELESIDILIDRTIEATMQFCLEGIDNTMSDFN